MSHCRHIVSHQVPKSDPNFFLSQRNATEDGLELVQRQRYHLLVQDERPITSQIVFNNLPQEVCHSSIVLYRYLALLLCPDICLH